MQRLAIDPQQLFPPNLKLTEEQQHYLQRVLRLKSGAEFLALPGDGSVWRCRLREGDVAEAIEQQLVTNELPIEVTLGLALPKGNAFDEVVRQVTELGVRHIVPLISERTLLKPSPNKVDRWQKIAIEAAEQSERGVIPTVHQPIEFRQYLLSLKADPTPEPAIAIPKMMCWGRGDSPHLAAILPGLKAYSSLILLIGPEGGWSDREVEAAIAAEFQTVSLGKRILRAVTAPVAAMVIVGATMEQ